MQRSCRGRLGLSMTVPSTADLRPKARKVQDPNFARARRSVVLARMQDSLREIQLVVDHLEPRCDVLWAIQPPPAQSPEKEGSPKRARVHSGP